jgi:hypothetical protein
MINFKKHIAATPQVAFLFYLLKWLLLSAITGLCIGSASTIFLISLNLVTSTPNVCMIMGMELFGAETGIYMTLACFVAYIFSEHTAFTLHSLSEAQNIHTIAILKKALTIQSILKATKNVR